MLQSILNRLTGVLIGIAVCASGLMAAQKVVLGAESGPMPPDPLSSRPLRSFGLHGWQKYSPRQGERNFVYRLSGAPRYARRGFGRRSGYVARPGAIYLADGGLWGQTADDDDGN